GCEFTPYVLAVRAGQRLLVRNSDPVLHNVHRIPAVTDNREFSASQPPNSPDLVFVLYHPELFLRFKCDVHPWMFAYVHVLHHPFFAVTDKDGKFSLPYVPLDECRLRMVHRKAGSKRTPYLTIPEQGGVSLDLHLEVPPQVASVPTVP
ncbi:MAG: hypothetical protein HYZ36_08130, partial [Pedosphaera parvula]|nr:hypothetical protein [Pedosphaera parvula]